MVSANGYVWDSLFGWIISSVDMVLQEMIKKIAIVLLGTVASLLWMTIFYQIIANSIL